jgi:amino acid transporter
MALQGTVLIIFAQALVSIAIIVYFRKHHPEDHHWWRTFLAPLIAFFAQFYVLWLYALHMDFLGGGLALANYIPAIGVSLFAIGLLGAFLVRRRDPTKFNQIGRLIQQGGVDEAN